MEMQVKMPLRKLFMIGSSAICFLSLAPIGFTQDFSGLEALSPEPGIKLHFDKAITRVVNRTIEHPVMLKVELAEVRIDRGKARSYLIEYSSGASDDPTFIVYEPWTKKKLAEIPSRELFIPGDGSVYASGHTNNMFNVRRKFSLKTGKLLEVKQPYLYVGLESEALTNITIYSDKRLTIPVESLKKGSKVSVLIADGDYFLIRTSFGLTGWILPERSQSDEVRSDIGGTGIKGLFFKGD